MIVRSETAIDCPFKHVLHRNKESPCPTVGRSNAKRALICRRNISIRALCNSIHCAIFSSSPLQHNSPGFPSINTSMEIYVISNEKIYPFGLEGRGVTDVC